VWKGLGGTINGQTTARGGGIGSLEGECRAEHWPDTTSNMKLSILLSPVKDNLGLRTPGVYRILYECSRVYNGQTVSSKDITLKEHEQHIPLDYEDKTAIAEHSIDQGHHIQFHNTSILATNTRYMDHIFSQAIETELHHYIINREGGFCLSKS
jgi:hypothetical protein